MIDITCNQLSSFQEQSIKSKYSMEIMTIPRPLKIVLILLLFNCRTTNCSVLSSIDLPYNQCRLFYIDNGDSNIIFKKCRTPMSYIFDWMTCLQTCCSVIPSDSSTPNMKTLQICSQQSGSGSSTATIIMITVFGSIFSLCLICCLSVYLFRRCKHQTTTITYNLDDHQVPIKEWLQEIEINNSMEQIRWSSLAKQEESIKDNQNQVCCICLDLMTNAELICRHRYHPKCIGKWLGKNKCCPCCRKRPIQRVKIYCQQCHWRYMICEGILVTKNANLLVSICPFCLEYEVDKQKKEFFHGNDLNLSDELNKKERKDES